MRRRDLLKRIRQAAKEANVAFRLEEGGNHTKLWLDNEWTTVPRHNQLDERLAAEIFKQVQGKLGEKWWR